MKLSFNLLFLAAASVISLPILSKIASVDKEEAPAVNDDLDHRETHVLRETAADNAEASNLDLRSSDTPTPHRREVKPRKPRPGRIDIRKAEMHDLETREPQCQCTTPPCCRSVEMDDPFEASMSSL